jgi:hypothetical protein
MKLPTSWIHLHYEPVDDLYCTYRQMSLCNHFALKVETARVSLTPAIQPTSTVLTYFPYSEQDVLGRTNHLLSLIWRGQHRNRRVQNSSIVAYVFVAAGTFLMSRCLATRGRCTYRHTDWWKGFMKYAVEMGLRGMIYIKKIIKTDSGIQKLMGGRGDLQTNRQHRDRACLLLFFQNEESRV